jgi:5'-nucleotidase
MRILLTNDDGIEAPGLDVLEKIATDLTDDVWVVAPETDNSGASHSLTLAEPLRMRELAKRRYAIKGTPTDCVIMGVRFLLHEKPPDLVMSGVNRGQNLADDITYSGTVAGAIQGCLLGIPSIAMSLVTGPAEADQGAGEPLWETPMHHGADLVRKLMHAGWPDGVVLNVNFPNCLPDAVKGMCATVQGLRDPDLFRIIDRLDARGRAYYWIGVERRRAKPPKGTDLWAVSCNQISVTPLCLDYTDEATRESLSRVLGASKEGERISQPAQESRAQGRAIHGHRE